MKKMTRRSLAGFVAVPALFSGPLQLKVNAQTPAPAANDLNTARADFQSAASQLASVKLARSVEPASRFEA